MVSRSRLGWDLFVRSSGVSLFYGARRPRLERGFAGSPKLLHAGALHWAGLTPGPGQLIGGLGSALWAAMRGAPSVPNPSPNLPRG